ncbi:hypothetical protein EAF00_009265 [Botryotinia globosa]|nr:hypothetical protein EAF00_009265 [Botryotinia globosa]
MLSSVIVCSLAPISLNEFLSLRTTARAESMIHVDLGTKGACPQQHSVEFCIFAALFLKFGRADDTVLVPAIIDT